MKRFARRNIYLLIALPILLVLLLCELVFFEENNKGLESARIHKVFEKKEKRLESIIDKVVLSIAANPKVLSDWSLLRLIDRDEEELTVTVSDETALKFWSSSLVAFPADSYGFNLSEHLVHFPTGWYYQLSRKAGAYYIRGFILIKREFPYRNRFIKSSFNKDFRLPDNYLVQSAPQSEALNIDRPDGTHLFSITTPNDDMVRF